MPKKTREEKIIANYRKRIKFLQEQAYIPTSKTVKPEINVQKNEKIVKDHGPVEINSSLKKFFMQDLSKSLLLIVFIITLEIILYFARIN
jgi:hypothetical protein